jgi:hypothetical protein
MGSFINCTHHQILLGTSNHGECGGQGIILRMGVGRNVYRVLVGKPEGINPLERPRRRWENGIKMDLTVIGLGDVEWIHLAQDRDLCRSVVNATMKFRVLSPRSYLYKSLTLVLKAYFPVI